MRSGGTEELKDRFLKCVSGRASNTRTLRHTVRELIEQGITRKTLVRWAVQAGYTRSGVSSLLSRILCSLGIRQRQAGAGRKPSPDALELASYARQRFGERALRVLRAAWLAEKRQMTFDQSGGVIGLIAGRQLDRTETTSPGLSLA